MKKTIGTVDPLNSGCEYDLEKGVDEMVRGYGKNRS
jgi:hypothetical protein